MSKIAVVPGSFDPITLGHLDVIRRAAAVFDEVHVLVVHNPGKSAMLPISERMSLTQQSLDEDPETPDNVIVASWSVGLLVDYCTEVGATVLVKGIRSQLDIKSYFFKVAGSFKSVAIVALSAIKFFPTFPAN